MNNEKLARWLGWKEGYGIKVVSPSGTVFMSLPDYLNDDAAAMRLLDALVEKGYEYELQAHYCYNAERVMYRLKLECIKTGDVLWADGKNYFTTRREAVVAACLELIDKGAISYDLQNQFL